MKTFRGFDVSSFFSIFVVSEEKEKFIFIHHFCVFLVSVRPKNIPRV